VNVKIRAVMDKWSSASSIADAEVGDDEMMMKMMPMIFLGWITSHWRVLSLIFMILVENQEMEVCFLPGNNKENDTENA
jgi:hypothetical protein